MFNQIIILICLGILSTGCSSMGKPEVNFKAEDDNVEKIRLLEAEMKEEKAKVWSDGSVFRADEYSDLMENNVVSISIGEILYINVTERVRSKTASEKMMVGSSNMALSGGAATSSIPGTQGFLDRNVNPYLDVGLESKKRNDFLGRGNARREEDFNTKMSVLVVEKIAKNLFKVEGKKDMVINNEKQVLVLHGYVHAANIPVNKTIDSDKILNLKMSYESEGSVSNVGDKSPVRKFFDKWVF